MNISTYFPIYNELTKEEQRLIDISAFERTVPKGTIVHNGDTECLGLTIVADGQLRAYKSSDDGREITLFRLLEYDVCLFSNSCTMQSFRADVTLSAEERSIGGLGIFITKKTMDSVSYSYEDGKNILTMSKYI